MINRSAYDMYQAQTALTPQGGADVDVDRVRAELAQERQRRIQAEATAAAAERLALEGEERAAQAEWLVWLLRSELTGDDIPRKRRWWPWRRWRRHDRL